MVFLLIKQFFPTFDFWHKRKKMAIAKNRQYTWSPELKKKKTAFFWMPPNQVAMQAPLFVSWQKKRHPTVGNDYCICVWFMIMTLRFKWSSMPLIIIIIIIILILISDIRDNLPFFGWSLQQLLRTIQNDRRFGGSSQISVTIVIVAQLVSWSIRDIRKWLRPGETLHYLVENAKTKQKIKKKRELIKIRKYPGMRMLLGFFDYIMMFFKKSFLSSWKFVLSNGWPSFTAVHLTHLKWVTKMMGQCTAHKAEFKRTKKGWIPKHTENWLKSFPHFQCIYPS